MLFLFHFKVVKKGHLKFKNYLTVWYQLLDLGIYDGHRKNMDDLPNLPQSPANSPTSRRKNRKPVSKVTNTFQRDFFFN